MTDTKNALINPKYNSSLSLWQALQKYHNRLTSQCELISPLQN